MSRWEDGTERDVVVGGAAGRRRRMSDAFSAQRVEPQGSSWTRHLYIENLKGERANYLTTITLLVITTKYEKASLSFTLSKGHVI